MTLFFKKFSHKKHWKVVLNNARHYPLVGSFILKPKQRPLHFKCLSQIWSNSYYWSSVTAKAWTHISIIWIPLTKLVFIKAVLAEFLTRNTVKFGIKEHISSISLQHKHRVKTLTTLFRGYHEGSSEWW